MADLEAVFRALREVMEPFAVRLECKADTRTKLYLETRHLEKDNPVFFGSVQLKKNYVSYHLMPVYTDPDLLAVASPELQKRMQGKSCFNFKAVDPALFEQLAALTEASFERYKQKSYV